MTDIHQAVRDLEQDTVSKLIAEGVKSKLSFTSIHSSMCYVKQIIFLTVLSVYDL